MSGKKRRDGAKAKAHSEPKASKAQEGKSEEKKPAQPKRPTCSKCGKAMKDARTLKLHERNCGEPKAEERAKPDPMLVALMDMKESMDAERRELLKYVADREAALQSQLSETKGALLAEVERVATARPAPASGIEVGSYREPPQQMAAPPQVAEVQPPQPTYYPPAQVDPDAVRQMVEAEVDKIAQSLAGGSGMTFTQEEIAALVKQQIDAALAAMANQAGPTAEDLNRLSNALETKLSELQAKLDEVDQRVVTLTSEKVEQTRLNRMGKDMERLDTRVDQLMDEVGFGESLDVSKIPSNILEIVYQATLDDVVREMGKTRSLQEVGSVIERTLEEVRKNTSGSELFRYNGRRIVTDNLARSIDQGLISAKQIQTTYAELLNRLLEGVPGYKPKNFRSMIKIKSQEYAVDRVTHLLGRVDSAEKIIDSMGQMIAAFSAQSQARFGQLGSRLDEIAGPMMERKVDASTFEELKLTINELRLAVADVSKENSKLLARMEMGVPPAQAAEEAIAAEEKKAEEPGLTDAEKLVVGILIDGPLSVSALRKKAEAFVSPEDCKAAIEGLQSKGYVESAKHGKGTRLTLVKELPKEPEAPVAEPAEPKPEEAAPAPEEIVYAPEAVQGEKPEGAEVTGEAKPEEKPEAPASEVSAEAQPSEEAPAEPTEPPKPEPVELTPMQRKVLEAVGDGATMPSLRKALEDVKYTEILVAVRILIDAGEVTAETHGRGTTYRRVKKTVNKEVKEDA